MVRMKGLEPPHLAVPDPKSGASANSATSAYLLGTFYMLPYLQTESNLIFKKNI